MISLIVPSVPPSVNQAYVTIRGGRRMLSAEGKAYKNETKTFIARNYPMAMSFFNKDDPYLLVIEFNFLHDELYCKGYPDKAESRYKALDVSNRCKLFEDALSEATGLNDSQNFSLLLTKSVGATRETHLWAFNRNKEENPIDELRRCLPAPTQPYRALSELL